jgi:hypothetical protein
LQEGGLACDFFLPTTHGGAHVELGHFERVVFERVCSGYVVVRSRVVSREDVIWQQTDKRCICDFIHGNPVLSLGYALSEDDVRCPG